MTPVVTKAELEKILDMVSADVECEADAKNVFQEGYAVGFQDCRARVLIALLDHFGLERS